MELARGAQVWPLRARGNVNKAKEPDAD